MDMDSSGDDCTGTGNRHVAQSHIAHKYLKALHKWRLPNLDMIDLHNALGRTTVFAHVRGKQTTSEAERAIIRLEDAIRSCQSSHLLQLPIFFISFSVHLNAWLTRKQTLVAAAKEAT
ncbi:hypothetical protein Ct61P_14554 [Colletotrichum tofieldiae]|nr:hypothetical protein Ct61P_14554 [Colletotrichum tofieldiae]